MILKRATAATVPATDRSFDAVIAVNTLQMCDLIDATARELAASCAPGARPVSVTHDWTMARRAGSVEAWVARARAAFEAAGLEKIDTFAAKAEKGRSIAFVARKPPAMHRV